MLRGNNVVTGLVALLSLAAGFRLASNLDLSENRPCVRKRTRVMEKGRMPQIDQSPSEGPNMFDEFRAIGIDTHITQPPDVWMARVPKEVGRYCPARPAGVRPDRRTRQRAVGADLNAKAI